VLLLFFTAVFVPITLLGHTAHVSMNQAPTSYLEIPLAWGWYRPTEHLARILRSRLEHFLPESELLAAELVLYHQNRDDVLLRRKELSDRVAVVHLASNERGQRIDFDGTFSEFAAREQRRYEIERRMIESPVHESGICPVCFAAVVDGGCGGTWTGSTMSKASNGPLHHATCGSCRSELTASPTYEESAAGVFNWEFLRWG
jgi:hypothetical protein